MEDAALRAAEATAKAEVLHTLSSGAREFVPPSEARPTASYRAARGGGGGGGGGAHVTAPSAVRGQHDAASPPPAAGGSLSVRHKAFLRRGRSKTSSPKTATKTRAAGRGCSYNSADVAARRHAAAGIQADEQRSAEVDALLHEGLAAEELGAAAAAAFADDPYAAAFSLAPFRAAPHSSPLGPGASALQSTAAAALGKGWGGQGGADAGVGSGEASSVSDVSASADSESSEDLL